MKEMTDEKIRELVKKTLSNAANIIAMIAKHGDYSVRHIDHGQLHIDHDDRVTTGWNNDLLKLFPLTRPVTMTSWKGLIAVHFLDETYYFGEEGTRAVFEYVLKRWGNEKEMIKKLESLNNKY